MCCRYRVAIFITRKYIQYIHKNSSNTYINMYVLSLQSGDLYYMKIHTIHIPLLVTGSVCESTNV